MLADSVKQELAAKGHQLDIRNVARRRIGEGGDDPPADRRPDGWCQSDRRQLCDGLVIFEDGAQRHFESRKSGVVSTSPVLSDNSIAGAKAFCSRR